jgi:hypothetical protein
MSASNGEEQLDLDELFNIGDALRAGGDLIGAKQHYEKFLGIMRQLANNYPSNIEWR